jgi:hypothetical protein
VRTRWRWAVHRPNDPAAYARKVLVNRRRSLLRRAGVESRFLAGTRTKPVPPPGDEQAMVLWQAGQGLPPRQRAVPPSAVPTGSPGPQSTAPSTSSFAAGPAGAGPWPCGASWPSSSPWPWPPASPPAHRPDGRPYVWATSLASNEVATYAIAWPYHCTPEQACPRAAPWRVLTVRAVTAEGPAARQRVREVARRLVDVRPITNALPGGAPGGRTSARPPRTSSSWSSPGTGPGPAPGSTPRTSSPRTCSRGSWACSETASPSRSRRWGWCPGWWQRTSPPCGSPWPDARR